VVWSAEYSAFGEATVDPASTVEINLRFPGQYFDEETGLHYNWQRYYNPEEPPGGRVLTCDKSHLSSS
jgi:RHS repeat-associated protein